MSELQGQKVEDRVIPYTILANTYKIHFLPKIRFSKNKFYFTWNSIFYMKDKYVKLKKKGENYEVSTLVNLILFSNSNSHSC